MASSTSLIQNLVLFVFLCIFTGAFSSFNGGKNRVVCNSRERQALLKFRHALNASANYVSPNPWVGEDCCSWDGVTCNNKTTNVIKLQLRCIRACQQNDFKCHFSSTFNGEIDPCLLELKHLNQLNLSNSDFGSKPIPMFFGLFKKLRYLDLSNSGFGGTIPQVLGNLSSLRHLDLGGNDDLRADNLHWLSHLSSLQHLGMYGVNLSTAADWLQEVNMLSSLLVLNLGFCHISDFPALPHLNFTSLTSLDLRGLGFDRTILQQLGNMSSLRHLNLGATYDLRVDNLHWLSHISSLQHLDMSYTNLSKASNWLQEINMLPSLSVLLLSICQLSDFPTLSYPNFTFLTSLDLSGNSISSKFPHWLVNLHDLVDLRLSNNSIKGPIPIALGHLCNLEILYLQKNKMDGDLNGFLQVLSECGMRDGRMSSIRELVLSSNNFSGNLLPESLGQLPNLKVLDMANNALEGVLPESLGQLPRLELLDVANNALEGNLSKAHFANLTRLVYLYMSSNSFALNVGDDWIPPFQLKTLWLGSCRLGPRFPMWLRHQKAYMKLSLFNAQIVDIIPHWFWDLSSEAQFIDLSHNQIRGQIPNSLNLSSVIDATIKSIDLSWNHLEGPLPHYISHVEALDLSGNSFSGPLIISIDNTTLYLALSKNRLNGSIPSSICESQSLYVLDLSDNGFTGQIPSCLEQLRWLDVLDLSKNQLSGDIPVGLISNIGLSWLQLSHNKFSGGLPSSFGIQDNFVFIDLSRNKLSGLLPTWNSKNLSRLRILNLRSNMFHGIIPAQLSQLPSLQILDLSHNCLSGDIPSSFGNLSSMKPKANLRDFESKDHYHDKQMKLVTKRNELEYKNTLSLVAAIDLSSNDLSGEIPEELTSLCGLQSLNLSGNQLEGTIPESIGKLRQLDSLDLSRNHLSGAIPTSIEALTFLGSLNISNNNLSGPIPQGNHLQTLLADPSTYMGNHDLCGPPLARVCQKEVPHTLGTLGGGRDEEDRVQKLWFYIGMASGFVIGFWCIFGPLLFSKSWRIAYYKFLDNLMDRLHGSL